MADSKTMSDSKTREMPLGSVMLKVHPSRMIDLRDIYPNPDQPRMGPKEDAEFRKQIEAAGGLIEPLLVEPHPKYKGKFLIIDGERRWTNCKVLLETDKKEKYRTVPTEVTDRTLTQEERLRAWVTIHRSRKDWTAKEKEMVAYALIDKVGRIAAANILGITVKEVDKLKEIYELAQRMEEIKNPDASISYAREIRALAAPLRTEENIDAIIKKVNQGIIKSSKEIRDFKPILKYPAAREVFSQDGDTIGKAKAELPANVLVQQGTDMSLTLAQDIDVFLFKLEAFPSLKLPEIRGNPTIIEKLNKCVELTQKLIKELKIK